MGLFSDLFSGSKAAQPHWEAIAARQSGLKQATGTLEGGYSDASKYLDTASGRFDPLAKTAGQGFDAYAQLYGIGGGDPTAAVRAQPGYQFSQNEAAEQLKRQQASIGALAGSNTMQGIFDRGANIADTKWQQYAEGLKPFLQLAPSIAQQQGGYDMAQSGLQKGLADSLAGYQTGTANANAQGLINAQQARAGAAKNSFDAIMSGVELAGKIATGGMFPSFGSMFGGGGGASAANSGAAGGGYYGSGGQVYPGPGFYPG
jgi:hypothetical protein